MSPAQRRVYQFVAQYIADNGYSPTVRVIQYELGYASTATVAVHLEHLRNAGYLAGSGRQLRLGFRTSE